MKREVADEINAIKNELSLISTRVAKLEESQTEVAIELPTNSLKTDPKECIEASLPKDKSDSLVFHNTVKVKRPKPIEKTPISKKKEITKEESTNQAPLKLDSYALRASSYGKNKKEEPKKIEIASKSLEEQIGSYWLNRIGIAALVIGLALLLMYSFQFYGPVFKVVTGLVFSIALILGGEWMDFKGEEKWYARGLIGGGWSIFFFTVFAIYHIDAVKLTDNFFLDWCLMAGVSVMSMTHALFRKSEIIAGLSMILSLVSIALCDASAYAWVASATLIVSLAYMAYKLDWYRLFFWGVIGSYLSFYCGIFPDILNLNLTLWNKAVTMGSFLGLYWLTFNITSLYLKDYSQNRKTRLIIASLINTFAFVPYMASLIAPLLLDKDYLFPFFVAVFYFAMYIQAKARNQKSLLDVNLLVALSSITFAVAMIVDSASTNIYWLMEIPLLVYLSMRYKINSVKVFAFILGAICGMATFVQLFSSTYHTLFGIEILESSFHILALSLSTGIVAAIYRVPSKLNDYGKQVSGLFNINYLFSYMALAALPLFLFARVHSPIETVSGKEFCWSLNMLFWTAQCFGAILLGLKSNDQFIKSVASFFTVFVTFVAVVISKEVMDLAIIVFASMLILAAAIYKLVSDKIASVENRNLFYIYFSCFAFLLWCLAITLFPIEYLALRWAMEAVLMVALGFALKDSNIRYIGGAIFASSILAIPCQGVNWSVFEVSSIVAMLISTAIAYRQIPKSYGVSNAIVSAQTYEVVAAILLTILIGKEVPAEWMTFAWSIEGFILLVAGFALKDKPFRISGLTVFSLVAMKLLFIDLAGAETVARILSFIAAGLILLVASYVYTKFAHRFVQSSRD